MNTRLVRLQQQQNKIVAGLMSGTSLDGIDCILTRLSGLGESTRIKPIFFRTYPYPPDLRHFLLTCSSSGTVQQISDFNFFLGKRFAEAVTRTARLAGLPLSKIDLIGSHGHTIQHRPREIPFYGKKIRSTLQIGDPAVIARETGIVTVGDFRIADMAAGGEGAPLVPYFDFLFFRSKTQNRLMLNLGGIANVTLLPKNCKTEGVFAFDTGPGNMIIDSLMRRYFGKPYDRNGRTAARGSLLPDLLNR